MGIRAERVAMLVAVVALLVGGFLVASVKWNEYSCERRIERDRATVRTDRGPIRAELAPLGAVVGVHWVLDPDRQCGLLPVPGTDRDSQAGVVRIEPARAADLVARYTGWEAADTFDAIPILGRYLPRGGTWRHAGELDAAFAGAHPGESARYVVDVASGTVLFSSYADHF
ncbi:hypothetical protein ACQP00_44795 [Dactylosporangium sp. CS-047395]|uniref:hypothetical protein n=1 Tax=Dactylosporangium sp. CS-047395 TaxID=3239936 RepID=UPI003D944C71